MVAICNWVKFVAILSPLRKFDLKWILKACSFLWILTLPISTCLLYLLIFDKQNYVYILMHWTVVFVINLGVLNKYFVDHYARRKVFSNSFKVKILQLICETPITIYKVIHSNVFEYPYLLHFMEQESWNFFYMNSKTIQFDTFHETKKRKKRI